MKVGTEQDWQVARRELLAAERELEAQAERVEKERRELPWVPVEKEYDFATENGRQSLGELFAGRSQLLIYHLMFGEDWRVVCPGCSSLVDGLSEGILRHLNSRDVTLTCMSQAPLEKLVAYSRVGPFRECGVERVRDARRRCLQHLPRVSTRPHHHPAVLRPARAAHEMSRARAAWGQLSGTGKRSPVCGSLPNEPFRCSVWLPCATRKGLGKHPEIILDGNGGRPSTARSSSRCS